MVEPTSNTNNASSERTSTISNNQYSIDNPENSSSVPTFSQPHHHVQEGINSSSNQGAASGTQDINQSLFNSQNIIGGTNMHLLEQSNTWHLIEQTGSNEVHPPCPRSLHASVAVNNNFYIFGGYDGTNRRNDFYSFNFSTN